MQASVIKGKTSQSNDILILALFSGHLLFVDLTTWSVIKNIQIHGLNTLSYPIDCVGWNIASDTLGKVVALASSNSVRFYTPPKDHDFSSRLINHHQINLDAHMIFNILFLPYQKGTSSLHLMFVVLYLSKLGDIKIALYSWWTENSISSISHYATTPLPPTLESCYPLFMIPIFCNTGAILLICQNTETKSTTASVITVNDLVSATLEHKVIVLPEVPTAYYQENELFRFSQLTKGYSDKQRIFFATESNKIYHLLINTESGDMHIEEFLQLPFSIGSTLLLRFYDSNNGMIVDSLLEKTDYLSIHTNGNGTIGGNFFFSKSGDNHQLLYYDRSQHWGPIHDGLEINTENSFSYSDYHHKKSEIFLASGTTSNSWELNHIRHGVRALHRFTDLQLIMGSQVFSASAPQSENDNLDLTPFNYILTTSFAGTRIFKSTFLTESHDSTLGDQLIEEFPQHLPIDFLNETKAFSSFKNYLIQITTKNIIITDLGKSTIKKEFEFISRAHIFENYILISSIPSDFENDPLSQSKIMEIILYQFDVNSPLNMDCLTFVAKTQMEQNFLTDVTSLWILPSSVDDSSQSIYVFVSILTDIKSSLKIFNVGRNKELAEIQHITNGISTPVDIVSVSSEDIWYNAILVGQRNGTYFYAEWNDTEFFIRFSYTIGDSVGVRFIKDGEKVFALCGFIYRLSSLDFVSPFRPELVVFDKNELDFPSSFCLFLSQKSDENEAIVFAAIFGDKLAIVEASGRSGYFTKSTPLAGPPRQLLYLDHIGIIATILNFSYELGDNEENAIQQSLIQFIDPKIGSVLDIDKWKPVSQSSKPNTGGNIYGSHSAIENIDKFLCMMVWTFKKNTDVYKYLVIAGETNKKGQLYLLDVRRKKSSPSVELHRRFSKSFNSPVFSIDQLDNNTIICVTSSSVELLRLELDCQSESEKPVYRLSRLDFTMNTPMRHVSVKNQFVYLSSCNSVQVYKYNYDRLSLLQSEDKMRTSIFQIVLDDNTLIVTDSSKNVTIYGSNSYKETVTSTNLEVLSEIQFPTLIVKVFPITATKNNYLLKHMDPEQISKETGKITQDLIALGVDGSMYMLHLINRENYKFLRTKIEKLNETPSAELESIFLKEDKKQTRVIDLDEMLRRHSNAEWIKFSARFNPINEYW